GRKASGLVSTSSRRADRPAPAGRRASAPTSAPFFSVRLHRRAMAPAGSTKLLQLARSFAPERLHRRNIDPAALTRPCSSGAYLQRDSAGHVLARQEQRMSTRSDYSNSAFSRDGHHVAIVGDDGTVRIHDVSRGGEVTRMIRKVGSLAFSPDGQW